MKHKDADSAAIHRHWEEAAQSPVDAQGLKPTARDPYLQQAVEAAVMRRLPDTCDALLDIGCGDGASTALFAPRARQTVGVDFVETFVSRARKEHGGPHVHFAQADVLALAKTVGAFGLFDAAISIRCLINLPDFQRQATALEQIASVLKPGGLYLTSEGWLEGFDGLNERRKRYGLQEMQVAAYNTLISRTDFEREVTRNFEIVGYESLGYYLFMSRVFQPLLVHPEAPSHTHPVNRIAMQTQAELAASRDFLDCDYAGLYVLRRR